MRVSLRQSIKYISLTHYIYLLLSPWLSTEELWCFLVLAYVLLDVHLKDLDTSICIRITCSWRHLFYLPQTRKTISFGLNLHLESWIVRALIHFSYLVCQDKHFISAQAKTENQLNKLFNDYSILTAYSSSFVIRV